jgi:hypothetical protein
MKMKIGTKEQKIRDRIIFVFNVIPTVVDVDRHVVYVELRKKDVDRVGIDLAEVEAELEVLIDRKVEVKAE